ncbi:MAG: MdtA/MuxA family multidrug efflux RND transporter periplasmic adaptor subunit [Syntrophales bacterium]|nr:MdtA/MuxA family multidrug efflux RND transporter periplasmic adaptor subunit [Syntrophales bacterium]
MDKRDLEEKVKKGAGLKLFKHWKVLLIVAGIVAVGIYLVLTTTGGTKSRKNGAATKSPPPVSVIADPVKKTDFKVYITGLGSVVPLNTVVVRTRVDGQLMEILFREGQIVKRGDLLAKIDPRPFEVQLTQAEGQMARDRELLRNANVDLKRYKVLWEQDSVPKQQLDTQEALVRQYEGTVKTDQGAIDSAKLQLFYCRITAPISGRLGLRLIDPGNIVHASDANGLIVITQLQPITVIFPIPEDNLPRVLARLKKGERLSVEAYDREMKQKLAMGYLMTIDNQIDSTTGTVRFKAVFANEKNELFPNQFVNVKLLVESRRETMIVPSSSIQRGPQGTFVYVVKSDMMAEVRPVVIDEIQGGEASVKAGLNAGELVVSDGTERLREGSKVELRPVNGGPDKTGSAEKAGRGGMKPAGGDASRKGK